MKLKSCPLTSYSLRNYQQFFKNVHSKTFPLKKLIQFWFYWIYNGKIVQYFMTLGWKCKQYETTSLYPYLSRAFQWYQSARCMVMHNQRRRGSRQHVSREISMWQTKQTNYLPLTDRLIFITIFVYSSKWHLQTGRPMYRPKLNQGFQFMGLATEMNALGEPAPTLVPYYHVTFFWVASKH
jgi:hypothetical protein